MLARELVTDLERMYPDISREDLLYEINYVHRIMMSERMFFMRASDPVSGEDLKITPTEISTTIADSSYIDRVYSGDYKCKLDVLVQGNTIIFKESQIGNEYSIRYYKKPTELLAETLEMDVLDDWVWVIEEGVCARIEGKVREDRMPWFNWRKTSFKEFKWAMNKQYSWGKLNE
jgi:hypothetical protein